MKIASLIDLVAAWAISEQWIELFLDRNAKNSLPMDIGNLMFGFLFLTFFAHIYIVGYMVSDFS